MLKRVFGYTAVAHSMAVEITPKNRGPLATLAVLPTWILILVGDRKNRAISKRHQGKPGLRNPRVVLRQTKGEDRHHALEQ